MQFDAHCIDCLVHRQFQLAMKQGDGQKADRYLRDVMQIILDAPKGVSAVWLAGAFTKAYDKYWPGVDAYETLKKESNDWILALLPRIRPIVENASDPLQMALKFSRTGNFLDFGILTPDIANTALTESIDSTPAQQLDEAVYGALTEELASARRLLILGDNAGEIVFDLLLVEQLKLRYPALEILYCVRGDNVLNDATRYDAAYVGMDKLCTVIDNGSAISGTELAFIGKELKDAIESADVILSKGSGNFESLAGCGLNIYYLFMCKCKRVAKLLDCENMTGQFLRDRSFSIENPIVGALE